MPKTVTSSGCDIDEITILQTAFVFCCVFFFIFLFFPNIEDRKAGKILEQREIKQNPPSK